MLVLLVGCVGSGGGGEAGSTTSVPQETSGTTAIACGDDDAEALTTEDGAELNAALLGEGEVGVVLGHQFRSDMCSWVPFAKQLAERGMRALAINFVSASIDADMVARARELQRRNVERIFLVGASMGGTAALVAAKQIDVAGVAALSAAQEFSSLDALPAVGGLDVPLLFLVGRRDERFARDARRLFQAASSQAANGPWCQALGSEADAPRAGVRADARTRRGSPRRVAAETDTQQADPGARHRGLKGTPIARSGMAGAVSAGLPSAPAPGDASRPRRAGSRPPCELARRTGRCNPC